MNTEVRSEWAPLSVHLDLDRYTNGSTVGGDFRAPSSDYTAIIIKGLGSGVGKAFARADHRAGHIARNRAGGDPDPGAYGWSGLTSIQKTRIIFSGAARGG